MSTPWSDNGFTHTNVRIMNKTNQMRIIHTQLRDVNVSRNEFIFASDRLARLLVEEGLNMIPTIEKTIITPTGDEYYGAEPDDKICVITIVRAGDIGVKPFREVCRGIRIGKILIQRTEKTAEPRLFYVKLPEHIQDRVCFLFDPMLATGGSAATAIKVLKDANVDESNIIFLNMIAAPEGIRKISDEYSDVRILTTEVDQCLNEQKYILPGCGDYGDRYFGSSM